MFALPAGVGAKALATAKKAKRVAKTFIVRIDNRKWEYIMTVDEYSYVCAKELLYKVSYRSFKSCHKKVSLKNNSSTLRNQNNRKKFILLLFHQHFSVITIQS